MNTKIIAPDQPTKSMVDDPKNSTVKTFSFSLLLMHPAHPKLRLCEPTIYADAILYKDCTCDIHLRGIIYKKIDVQDIMLWSGSIGQIMGAIKNHIRNLVFPDIDILFLTSKAA